MKKGFRNPTAIIGMSSAQAGCSDAAVSPSTPGSAGYSLSDTSQASSTSSPSVSPAPTPSSLDFRPLRPQRHSTGMMNNGNPNSTGGAPSTPPVSSSAHTSPLAVHCPSPCPSPTVLEFSNSKQTRSSIARPRPRAISTGNLKVGAVGLPPPSTRIHAASPSLPASVSPLQSIPQPSPSSQVSSPFPPSHRIPTPMIPASSPPPTFTSISLGPASPQLPPAQPQSQAVTINSPPRPSSAGRRVPCTLIMDMPADTDDPHVALQPMSDGPRRCPSYRELEKEFLE